MRRYVLVGEARADFFTAGKLADRVLLERGPDWLRDQDLSLLRRWIGFDENTEFARWTQVRGLAQQHGIRAYGHFDGQPGASDGSAGRKVLRLVARLYRDNPVDGVLLIRDADSDDRLGGLTQARDECHGQTVVIGVAIPRREAWAIAGFIPLSETERANGETLRAELGFDPCENSHSLTAKGDKPDAKRNAKAVLRQLTGDDWEREERCWCETPLETLENRGRCNGLAAYLDEVRERIATQY